MGLDRGRERGGGWAWLVGELSSGHVKEKRREKKKKKKKEAPEKEKNPDETSAAVGQRPNAKEIT